MINATFSIDEKTKELRLTVCGHAGAAQQGKDLICAAASMLVYTAAQDALDLQRDGRLRKKAVVRLHGGNALIACLPTDDAYAEMLHTMFIIQKGFLLLTANHPKYVQVTTLNLKSEM